MNKETFNQSLPHSTDAPCVQAEQLVAYLYGETTEAEATRFEQHLTGCAACAEEMAAFGHMRKAVGAWRDAALSAATSLPAFEVGNAGVINPVKPPKRSARTAIREFFNFAPLWLRIGGAVAATVICALAVLGVANAELRWDSSGIALRTGTERGHDQAGTSKAETIAGRVFTQEEVDRMLAERMTQERAALLAELKEQTSPALSAVPNRESTSSVSAADPVVVAQKRRVRRSNQSSDLPRSRPSLGGGVQGEPQLYDLLGEVDE